MMNFARLYKNSLVKTESKVLQLDSNAVRAHKNPETPARRQPLDYCGSPGVSVRTRKVSVPTVCPFDSAFQVRVCHSGFSVEEAT